MSSRTWKVLVGALIIVLFAVPTVAAFHDGGPKTDISETTNEIFHQVTWVSIAVFLIVEVMLVYFLIRYRKRAGGPEKGPDIHGSTKLEVAWTIGPALVMVWLLIISFNGMQATDFPTFDEPEDIVYIDIVASQFTFSYKMPDGTEGTLGGWNGEDASLEAIDTLEFRSGTTVVFNVTATDVIHAFSVPELDFIIDANPGRPTQVSFTARDPGAYIIQCRQFCGIGHGAMTGALVVFPEDDPRIGNFAPRTAAAAPGEEEITDQPANETGDEPPEDVDRTIDVSLFEWGIDGVAPGELEPGERIFFRVTNEGPNAQHNLYLGSYLGSTEKDTVANSVDLAPGATASFVFEVPEDGGPPFDYWCDVPGHAGLGMLIQAEEGPQPRLPGPHPLIVVALLAGVALFLARRR
ncbi:MAG: hypothetical protein KY455_03425 [Euryarchaeota archaeon]|nr:hypothetical protein [Euryarchaeota archaeon]